MDDIEVDVQQIVQFLKISFPNLWLILIKLFSTAEPDSLSLNKGASRVTVFMFRLQAKIEGMAALDIKQHYEERWRKECSHHVDAIYHLDGLVL